MSGERKGPLMATTRVKTTIGRELEVDDAELLDLRRLGLVASGRKRKDTAAASVATDEAEAPAAAESKGGAE